MRIRRDRLRALAAGSWHSLGSRASDAVIPLQSIADLVKLSVAQWVAKLSRQHGKGEMFVKLELCRRQAPPSVFTMAGETYGQSAGLYCSAKQPGLWARTSTEVACATLTALVRESV